MSGPVQISGQVVVMGLFMAAIGFLSNTPVYQSVPDGQAQIKLSFAHGGARKIDCRKLTSKEIAALPPNERRPNTCSRERIPLHIQLSLNGELIFDRLLPATGLSSDGPSRVYTKLLVPAGEHVLVARLRDTKRAEGFDFEARRTVQLKSFQNLAIDFRADAGGFSFR